MFENKKNEKKTKFNNSNSYLKFKFLTQIITILILFILLPIQTGIALSNNESQGGSSLLIFDQESDLLEPNFVVSNLVLKVPLKPANNCFYIISINGPIEEYMKQEIVDNGAVIAGYLGDYQLLVKSTHTQVQLLNEFEFISNISEYSAENKFSKSQLTNYINTLDGMKPRFIAQIFQMAGSLENRDIIINDLEQLGGQILSFSNDRIEFEIESHQLDHVIELNDILWVEPAPRFSYFNDISSQIIGAEIIWNDVGLNGTGQIITVCDTGLDNGSYSNLHKDFRGRLLHAYALGRNGDWSDADIGNSGGHGTHVAGSVLGGGNWSNGQIKGMAYNASLVFQSTMTGSGNMNVPSDMYNSLYYPPYNSYNSKIHTNSWGDMFSAGEYDSSANVTDHFIWDHPDMIILFAAGNILMSSDTTPPGTAKNVITVGASESYRPTINFPGYPNSADNIDQIASFSCYGTDDNRLKPDILCPGTGILSTRSSLIANPDTNYWLGYDAFYAYAGGTSMATPITAGAVALIRQYFTDIENIEPSAALVKASLINGAEDMAGTGGSQPIPNYHEGWGRINISKSIKPESPASFTYLDNDTGLTSYKNYTYSIEVLNDSVPLNITLVWTDYPGSPAASFALVNDLHLNLTHEDSEVSYKGNVFNSGWSTSDDSYARPEWDKYNTGYDNINNVECIRIKKPKLGRYKITIVGMNIPFGPQPFAVALSGALTKEILPPNNILVESDPMGNSLNLTWNRVYGSQIRSYTVYRSTSPDSGFVIINETAGPGVIKLHDTGLTDGVRYYYKLQTMAYLGQFSNLSHSVSGIPKDLVPPNIVINNPTSGQRLNKHVKLFYTNDSDCNQIIFRYYNDTNKNGIADDNNSWNNIGVDTNVFGTFWWNTSEPGIGPMNSPAVLLSAETFDEVPNTKIVIVKDLKVDNQPPDAPVLINEFIKNPTNSSTLSVFGLAPEVYCEITIYSNGNLIGNTTSISKSLTFEVEVSVFPGLNSVNARAYDDLGNGPGPTSNTIEIMFDDVSPVAYSGGNFVIDEDTWFTFNGSESYDSNPYTEYNNITEYIWNFKNPNGTEVLLNGIEAQHYFDTMGNYSVTLSVRDMAGNWADQTFWINVLDNTSPNAKAGPDIIWNEDTILILSANRTNDNDPNFHLTGKFQWNFVDYDPNQINNGKIKMVELYGKNISYNFTVPDVYQIVLNATDYAGNWDIDIINVTIRDNTPPKANAGPDGFIFKGRSFIFDGSNSTDNDPNFFETGNFTWEFNYVGKYVFLYGIKHEFRFRKDYTFDIRLTVRDKWNNSDTDEFILRVDADILFPNVAWTYPKDYSTQIPVTSVIKIKINETIDIAKTPINNSNLQVFDSLDNELRGNIFYEPVESLILFVPMSVLRFSESHTVFLHSTIVDLAGNRLDGNKNGLIDTVNEDKFKFVFRTLNMSLSPKENMKDVSIDTEIRIVFHGNISNPALNSINISLNEKLSNLVINGSLNVDTDSNEIIFAPINELELNKEYKVSMVLRFYLISEENLTFTLFDRENTLLPDNMNNITQLNSSTVHYTWSFTTESSKDPDSIFDLGLIGDMLQLICISIIIIIIIVLVILILVISRRRLERRQIAMEQQSQDMYRDTKEDYQPYSEYDEHDEHDENDEDQSGFDKLEDDDFEIEYGVEEWDEEYEDYEYDFDDLGELEEFGSEDGEVIWEE